MAFDVISIKRNASGAPSRGRVDGSNRYTATSVPLLLRIQQAYDRIPDNRIVNVPDWARTDRYDLIATALERVALQRLTGPLLQRIAGPARKNS